MKKPGTTRGKRGGKASGALMVGTAGWAIPRELQGRFPSKGSGLERYAAVFPCLEINSTFKRSHRRPTFERWRSSVPADFRFAVKFPSAISHEARLTRVKAPLLAFLDDVSALSQKLGPLLLQLPPSLPFEPRKLGAVLKHLRAHGDYQVVCEPRHVSWFTPQADAWLAAREVSRVTADPARHENANAPGGWPGLVYYRLHGSPRMYYSPYGQSFVERLANEILAARAANAWCIFDNTASGAATRDALYALNRTKRLSSRGGHNACR